MPEIYRDGSVKYREGEKVKTAAELLASSVVVEGSGLGFERKPNATDLSPVKPVREYHSEESNRIVRELAMSNPLKNLPDLGFRRINITPISVG